MFRPRVRARRFTMRVLAVCVVFYVFLSVFIPSGTSVPESSRQEDVDVIIPNPNRISNESKSLPVFSFLTYMNILAPFKDRLVQVAMRSLAESVDGSRCKRDLEDFVIALAEGNFWAIQMADATSKIPSGLLGGNLFDFGAYDQCVEVSTDYFTGQHCLVVIKVNFNSPPPFLSPGVLKGLGNSVDVTQSVCVPSSCRPETLTQALAAVAEELNPLLSTAGMTLKISVDRGDCHILQKPHMEPAEVVGIAVTLGILFVVLICTVVDLTLTYKDKEFPTSGKQVPRVLSSIVAFSVYSNGRRLLSTRSAEGNIEVLHSLKYLSIAWVAIAHHVKFYAQGPLTNLLKLADYVENWSAMIVLNATLSVDVFFVISGILNTYVYMNASPRGRSVSQHFTGYVHRYIRLTPAYSLMILVTATWLYRTGDGPLWDRMVGSARNECTGYWWSSLLYINNYYNPNHNCMMQSWYLAADMQLFWLSPLVLYPLWRWPKIGLLKLGLLVILSIIVPFLVAYINLIKTPIPLSFDKEKVNREMTELYLPTHTKTVAYVIGILCGYLLHLVRNKQISFKVHGVKNTLLWVAALVSMSWAVFAGHSLFQLDSSYDRWSSSLYIAFYRFFWSAGVAWIIVACTTGHGGCVHKLLSWKVWAPLGRLTYSIYLTHVAVILYNIGSMRQAQHFSYSEMIFQAIGEFVIATLLAVVLTLTVESPVMALEKIFLTGNRKKRRVSFRSSPECTTPLPSAPLQTDVEGRL